MDEGPGDLEQKARAVLESPWTILSTFLCYVFWRGFKLLREVLKQPRQHPFPTRQRDHGHADLAVRARQVAEANVRECLEERPVWGGGSAHILCAGRRNFREPWARDFAFACFGLMALGEHQTVREGLQVFFRFQRPNGQLPVKVHSTWVLERYLHSLFGRHQPILQPLKPKFLTGHRTVSLDGNGLLVIAACTYGLETGDREFLAAVGPKLGQALDWMASFAGPSGLLQQGAFTDWADTVARQGTVAYTNVVYWKALELVARVQGSAERLRQAEAVRRSLLDSLWLEGSGYLATLPGCDVLSSDGNLLAVAWGLLDQAQSERVLDALDARGMGSPVPTRCTDRAYPARWIAVENYLAGIPNYHTSAAWMHLGGWHVVAALEAGRPERAAELLAAMDEHVVQDDMVYEVYGPDGHPLRSFWYKSEAPLTWNAAVLLYAHHRVEKSGMNV